MRLFYERGCQEQTYLYLADSLPLVSQPLLGSELLFLSDLTVRFAFLYCRVSFLCSLASFFFNHGSI
jgi:hypothetical protein